MYYKMKTVFLEDTLSDVLSEDGFELSFDGSQGESSNLPDMSLPMYPEQYTCPNLQTECSQDNQTSILTNDDYITKSKTTFEPVEELELNKNAWGKSVSQKEIKEAEIIQVIPRKSSISSKLFSNSSFTKRNPRKSLSRHPSSVSNASSNLSLNGDNNTEHLPDLETILSQKSQQNLKDSSNSILNLLSKNITTDVDKGWLNRCLSQDGSETLKVDNNLEVTKQTKSKFGLTNINFKNFTPNNEMNKEIKISGHADHMNNAVPLVENITENDSDSIVSNSEDETDRNRSVYNRPALKRRRIEVEERVLPLEQDVSFVAKTENKVQSEKPKKPNTKQTKVKKVKKPVIPTQKSPNVKEGKNVQRPSRNKDKISYCEKDLDNAEEEESNSPKDKHHKKPGNKGVTKNISKTTSRLGKSKVAPTVTNEQDEEETQEPYTLAIDSEQLSSLPRANITELNAAVTILKKYVHKPTTVLKKIQKKSSVAQEKLETKMSSGRVNENFVRINLRKKVFVRGKKTINYSKYKKGLWKQKKAAALTGPDMDMRGCDGGVMTCFKCGLPGHFAQNCPIKGDNLLPLDAQIVDDSPFPTLEEVEQMATQQALPAHSKNIEILPEASNKLLYKDDETSSSSDEEPPVIISDESKVFMGHKIPEEFLKEARLLDNPNTDDKIMPLYDLKENGDIIDPPEEVFDALRMFGHKSFRKGQDKAIMRILSGVSTLVTLSTGSGKSLCYQLPAYLYSRKKQCLTLVISPLVSLMEDQVHGVPMFLNAQCLHTNQTPQQRQKVLEMINSGKVDILLLSPEAVVAGEKSTGFGSLLRSLPSIAFACIDEVHCVSQWSHNFRPSYLMICKVLKNKLGVRTILGLTATATYQTRESIIRHLDIRDGVRGLITDTPLPDNLILSVSRDANRDAALIQLLRSSRFETCQSIIIYCTRRDECERVAGMIRTCLQDVKPEETNTKKRKRVNWHAEPYHAGMASYRRRTIQNAFMRNELRIVVATVAFGMGINKPDIRAIIHYNMPKNFESYVQEVGRAGRDGKLAQCHLFLDSKGLDQNELRRHIYANSIDRHVIRKLLAKVFLPCSCDKNLKEKTFVNEYSAEIKAAENIDWTDDFNEECEESTKPRKRVCPGHEIGIPIDKTVEALDIPSENITTLICYLELDSRWFVKAMSNAYTMCKVISYGGPKHIKQAAKDCPPLAMAIALDIKRGAFDESANVIEFSVIDIASAIGWNSGVVKYQLKKLEWITVNGLPRRSLISISFFELGFRIQTPGDLTDNELDEALDTLYSRSVQQEKSQLIQLQCISDGLSSVASNSHLLCANDDTLSDKSDQLKVIIRKYFENARLMETDLKIKIDTSHDGEISHDVRSMFNMYPENNFSGRNIARIFHGISSPNYPALMWSRCKYWRTHFKVDFNHIVKVANSVILDMRS